MFPAAFEYRAPETLDEVLDILAERGEDAKVLAGGQSLVPLIKLRFARPELLVDLNGITGLDDVIDGPVGLRIGALVRHRALAEATDLDSRYAAITAAAPLIADPLIRNRGTVAGSLAHCDPAADWASVMVALRASVHVRSSTGERDVLVDALLEGPFTTQLEATEVITAVVVPAPPDRSGGTYLKLERRVGDFATVGAAVQLELSNGHIGRAGIALTAVGPRSVHATDAEAVLIGAEPGPGAFDEAADLAARAADPVDDVRGSADYKRNVVRVFVRRGLDRAHSLAQDPEEGPWRSRSA
ncbi:MAG: xanthine dehydrogenase family protein subunit M [Candidatus Nanopelagicales bacterium]